MPCFFRARLSELGIPTRGTAHIVAVPTGGEARTTHLGEQLAEGACWHWRPAILRFPTATVCSGLGSPPCIRMACWNGRPASLRICGGEAYGGRWLFQYPVHKNEWILQHYYVGMTILGNEPGAHVRRGVVSRARHGKLCMAASFPERGNEPRSGYLLLLGEAFFMLWTTFSRCRNMAS